MVNNYFMSVAKFAEYSRCLEQGRGVRDYPSLDLISFLAMDHCVAYNHTYDSAYILPHKDYFLLGYFPQEIYGLVLHLPYAFLTQYTLFTLLLSA